MPDLLLLLGDEVAGTVTRLPGGRLTLAYDAKYVAEHVPATPVSVSMPSQIASHTDAQVAPWLWGLLPDNDAVLSRVT